MLGYIDIPECGAKNWKASVPTAFDLPTNGNSLGDARIALDTDTIYIWSGSAWVSAGGGGGTVTGVTATSPLHSSGGTAPNLTIDTATALQPGALSAADWVTFNSKQNALTLGNITDAGTDGITITGGTGAIIGAGVTLSQHVADTTHNGFLSSANWNSFNSRAFKSTQIIAGTGLTGGGDLSADRTLSLPNVGTPGAHGSAITSPIITTDAQGRITSVTNTPIPITPPTYQSFTFTVGNNSSFSLFVSLGTFIHWDTNFVSMQKVSGGVVDIPFADCTGVNTLDYSRERFADGVPDTAASYLVNAIAFSSVVSVGDTVQITYLETANLQYKTSIAPKGWDFINNTYYGGYGTDWIAPSPTNIPELYSRAVPLVVRQGGTTVLQSMGIYTYRGDIPSYQPTTYRVNASYDKEIRFLTPNALIDQSAPLDYDYTLNNIRIEMWEFPREIKSHTYSPPVATPYGKYNYMGYWTHNTMRLPILEGMGQNHRYANIGFRLRDMSTNSVSDWLPLKIYVRRGFRPSPSVTQDYKRDSILIQFSYY